MSSMITRRQFTAGLLASTAVTWKARAEKASAGERIRAAVMGCRYRGWQLAYSFNQSGRFDVQTLCDCDSAMFDQGMKNLEGKLPRTPRYEKDFRKVLDDPRIEAVALAVPDHWHALMACMALEAGKHVYVEKPLAYSIDEGRAILAAEKRHRRQVVAVGTQQRSGQHFLDARAFIRAGGLGKVGFARGWESVQRGVVPIVPDSEPPATLDYDLWRGPAPMRPYNVSRVHYNWHFMHDTGTGDMGNWGAHWLDSIRHLLDLDVPRSASAVGGTFVVKDAKEFPDTHTVLYDFGHLTVLWEQRHWTTFKVNERAIGAEIGGEKGTIIIDRDGWVFYPTAVPATQPAGKPEQPAPVPHPTSPMEEPHIANFAECIHGHARPAAPVEEAHKSAILIHLGNISLRVGRSVRFDSAGQRIIGDDEANAFLGREFRSPWKLPA